MTKSNAGRAIRGGATLAVALAATFGASAAAGPVVEGPMRFDPIPGSAYGLQNGPDLDTTPWVIPEGYTQRIVSDESDLDLYVGNDWTDMNTVNETGKHAGRYLFRTHEVRPNSATDDGNSLRVDGGSGGAVSVVDLRTGVATEIAGRSDWEALDGILWTPWRTVLFAEEVITSSRPDPDWPQATSGLLYELFLDPSDPSRAEAVVVRPQLGALSHEGIEVDEEGNVYVIDEDRRGSIYKFVPDRYGDLSSGQLHALRVEGGAKTGPAAWVALDMAQAQVSARVAAAAVGATQFCRPEDLERIGETLYVALTCEDVANPANLGGPSAVLAIALEDDEHGKRSTSGHGHHGGPVVSYVVAPGKNVPFEVRPTATTPGVTGFRAVDNLAKSVDGKLWMVEDNDWSDIWVYDPESKDAGGDGYRDGVYLFASLKDRPAEGTGIYFGKDSGTLFVNVQHSGTGNDKTMAISRRQR